MKKRSRLLGKAAMTLVIIFTGSIFAREHLLNHMLPSFPASSGWLADIADASVTTIVMFPLFYFFYFRPFKKLKSRLRESEEQFRSTFDQAAVGIARVSASGTFLEVNRCWCEIVGYAREELMMTSFQDLTHPDDLHNSLSHLTSLLSGESRIYTAEKRYIRKDKSFVWVHLTVSLIRKPGGAPDYFFSVIEDITERKRAEAAMHESETKLNVILESTADGILAVDARGKVLKTNKRFAELWHIPQCLLDSNDDGALLNHVLDQLVEPEAFLSKVRLLYGSSDEDRDTLYFKDGRTFERYSAPIVTDGENIGRVWSFRDITERRQVEEALRESDKKFRTLYESSHDALMTVSPPSWLFTSCNRSTVEMFRAKNIEELISCGPASVSPERQPDGRLSKEKAMEMIATALREGSHYFEWTHKRIDGEEFPATVLLTRMELEGKEFLHATVRDITQRKQTEQEIADTLKYNQTIFEASPIGIVTFKESGEVISANNAAATIIGGTVEQLQKQNFRALKSWEQSGLRDAAMAAISSGDEKNVEVHHVSTFGKDLWLWARFVPFLHQGHMELLLLISNITERKHTEEALRQAQKLESLGTLAGGIAHDFNNVLGGIMGYTEMSLQYVEKDSKLQRNLFKVLKATNRAKHLIDQILTFSRKTNTEMSITSIRPLITEALDLLRASIPSSVIIEVELDKNAKPVLADPTKIHEVLLNLATNAVHAMDRKGTMTIRLTAKCLSTTTYGQTGEIAPGEYTVIEVTDTGCGMDPETLSHAFEPFFTTKAVDEGTGMGLSVVLGVIRTLGGNIQVESEVGKGSTFKLYLPVAEESVSVAEHDGALLEVRGTERILFVDDEVMMVDMAKDMLAPLGYTVTGMSDSMEALDFIEKNTSGFDILITDQTMPNMTGMELAKETLKIIKDFPIILCTGFSSELNPERAAAIGVKQLLMKPYRADEIGKTIRKIFDNGR